MTWLRQNWAVFALIAIAFFGGRLLWPRTVTSSPRAPFIVTKYDTVSVPPRWLADSVRVWKQRRVTTDSFNLLIARTIVAKNVEPPKVNTVTVHDTVHDTIGVWPLLTFNRSSSSRPDTAFIRTFRGSQEALMSVYASGPVISIFADTTPLPRIQFGEWPTFHTSSWTKGLWAAIGFGSCALAGRVK
jgi:hypothetical protein